jgi:hypothetical protein
VAELYAADFPPPRFVVPDLLPAGLTILAGRPKLGKSWLALQVAAAVGASGSVLDQRADAGSVLYLALEDTPGRLKERALKQGIPAAAAITFHTEWAALSQQGLVDLLLAASAGHRLIVIDTLSRSIGRADPMDAVDMTLLLGSLHRLAARHDLALLLGRPSPQTRPGRGRRHRRHLRFDRQSRHRRCGVGSLQAARRAGRRAQGDGTRSEASASWR